jgi:hypothetical protein
MALVTDFELHRSLHLQSLETLHRGIPEGLPNQLDEITPILEEFDARVIEISKDDTLSHIGKDNALKTARETAAAEIEVWRVTKVNGLEAQISASRVALQTQADKNLSNPTDLQITNMVQRFRDFDSLEAEILYADATDEERRIIEVAAEAIGRQPVKRGDKITWEPIIAAERIEAVKEARIAAANPEGMAALNDLQRIKNTYDFIAGGAKGLIQEAR